MSWPRIARETLILWGIVAASAAVYLRCLENNFVLDDIIQIVKNPDIPDWSFLWKAFTRNEFWYSDAAFVHNYQSRNYRPLIQVWYWMDYHLFGLHPAPWHASIVLVHLIAVWLVFKITRRLAGGSISALLAAAAFGLTPIHAGTVVWMAACGMVLGTTLILAAFDLIISGEEVSMRSWAVAIALYAGALLSHESMAVFPALVACYAFIFYPASLKARPSRPPSWFNRARRALIWQAPFAVELLLYLIVRKLVLGFFVSNPNDTDNLLTNAQAVLTVPIVMVTYLTMLAMPWLTAVNHRVFPVSSLLSKEFWEPLIAVVIMLVAFLVVALRSPARRLYLFCAAWVGITMLPMLVLHSVPHLVQDYCLYLPSVGWCLVLGDLIASMARKNELAWRLALAGATAMFIVYAVVLWRVQWFWHDDIAAARGYVEGFPESVRWRWALATHLDQQGDFAGAEEEIKTALRLEPDRTGIIHPYSHELHHFLGELLARRGDINGAELEFAKSVNDPVDEDEEISSQAYLANDNDARTLYDQGVRDASAGRTDQAIVKITKALEIMNKAPMPDYGPLALRYIKLAALYDSLGNKAQVESVLKQVDAMSEGELAVGLARAQICLDHSDKESAERILLKLVERYPTNSSVLLMLGDLEFNQKKYNEALGFYERASGGWFADGRMHLWMARSLHAMGRNAEALDQCRLAGALSPRDPSVTFYCSEIGSS